MLEHFPHIIGQDGKLVLLKDLVAVIDGLIDYQEVHEQLPSLSLAQIAEGMNTIRKISQLNSFGIDLDDLEDKQIESSPDFIAGMVAATEDRDVARTIATESRDPS